MGLFGNKNEAVSTIRVNYKGKDAENGLKGLKSTIKTVITVAAIKQVAQYGTELAQLGAKAQLVEKNFANFAKQNNSTVQAMTSEMRKASLGMISDMELQQRAMQAMVAGVSFDDIITSMEYVTKFASATGADVNQKMMTVFTGLARGSAQFLDDVGIQVMGSKDVVNDAMDQMKDKMNQFATSEDDAAIQAAALKGEIENIKIIIGQALIPVMERVVPLIKEAAEGWRFLLRGKKEADEAFAKSDALAKEVMQLQNMRKEYEQIRDTQLALKAQKGTLFSPDTLQEAEDNIWSINEMIKSIGDENKKIAGQSGGIFDPKAKTKTTAKKTKKSKEDTPELKSWTEWMNELELRSINHADNMNAITSEEYDDRISIKKEAERALIGESELAFREQIALLEYKKELYPELENEINLLIEEENRRHNEKIISQNDEAIQQRIDNWKQGLDVFSTVASAAMNISDARTKREIENIEASRMSEEKKEKEIEKLQNEADQKRKSFARLQQGIAIAEATINAIKMGVGAGADTPGGPLTRGFAVAAALGTGFAQVAAIQAQQFALGRIGDEKRSRQSDTIPALLGVGESVISAPQTAMHKETLQAIQNNTANTRALSGGRGGSVNNFYGASLEETMQIINDTNRRKQTGLRI